MFREAVDALESALHRAEQAEQELAACERTIDKADEHTAMLLEKLEQAEQERYVPGDWHCQTCGFELHKRTLRAADGAVGVDTRDVQDICPNDGMSMRPTTWQQAAESSERVAMQQMERAEALQAKLTEAEQERDDALKQINVVTWKRHYEALTYIKELEAKLASISSSTAKTGD